MSKQTEIRKSLIALIKEAAMREIPLTKNDALQELGFSGKKEQESEPWRIEKSDIHGKGIFAVRGIPVGGHVAHSADLERDDVGLGNWELSEAGRYTNHSPDPNTIVTSDGKKMTMVAASPIEEGDEIKVSYFQVSNTMSPGTRLTYKGKPMRSVDAGELSKWAMDME